VVNPEQTGSAEATLKPIPPQELRGRQGFDPAEGSPQQAEPPEDREVEKKKGFFSRFRKKEATEAPEEPPREEPEEESQKESKQEIAESFFPAGVELKVHPQVICFIWSPLHMIGYCRAAKC